MRFVRSISSLILDKEEKTRKKSQWEVQGRGRCFHLVFSHQFGFVFLSVSFVEISVVKSFSVSREGLDG